MPLRSCGSLPPADAEQPGARRSDWSIRAGVAEKANRRERVGEARDVVTPLPRMSGEVAENVAERVRHLAPRAQYVRVIPVGPDLTGAIEQPVQRLCNPDRKALHPSPERFTVLGLDENVQ